MTFLRLPKVTGALRFMEPFGKNVASSCIIKRFSWSVGVSGAASGFLGRGTGAGETRG